MDLLPLQSSFAAGEISPLLHMRKDLPGLSHGAKTLANMFAVSQGAVISRKGSRFVATVAGVTKAVFLEFPVSEDLAFVVVVTKGSSSTIVIAQDSGPTFIGAEVLSNPNFAGSLADWDNIQSGSGSIYYSSPGVVSVIGATSYPNPLYSGIRQQFTTVNSGSHHIRVTASPGDAGFGRFYVKIGSALDSYGVPNGDVLSATMEEATEFDAYIPIDSGTTLYIGVYMYQDAVYTPPGFKSIYLWTRFIYSISITDPSGSLSSISHTFSDSVMGDLVGEMVPGANVMYLVSRYLPPTSLTYNASTGAWSLATLSFTSAPAVWGAGNYPKCITFYQGRSWWAGVNSDPETFWGSKSGDYLDLTLGSLADDAISYTLNKKGAIQWMKGANSFVIGTAVQEYIVSSDAGIVIPGDVEAKPQGRTSSGTNLAIDLGNKIVFANLAGNKIHDMGYKWEEEKWIAREISYVSEHLFSSDRPVDFAFIDSPERMIVVLTSSGKIHTCLYDDANNIIGWHRHPSSRNYIALATLTTNGRGHIYAGYISSNGLELVQFHAAYCLDDYHVISYSTASASIEGVTHLAGQTVGVIADGVVQADVTLDSNGDGTIAVPANTIVVGLKYDQTLVTLPLASESQFGTTMGLSKRYNKIFLRLVNSYIPKINGVRPRFKRSDSVGFEETGPLVDGFIEVSNLGFSKDGSITIVQDDPLPICITGIYGEAVQEKV